MRLPRHVAPAARARRALLFDVLAAVALATAVVIVSAGIGVVGFAGLLVAIVLILWISFEKGVRGR